MQLYFKSFSRFGLCHNSFRSDLLFHLVFIYTNVALRLLATQTLASQGINKTPNVCGGDACVGKTRIPVWSLVSDRRLGMSDPEILAAFPTLSAVDLVNAWVYAERHLEEIESAIRENEVIMETEVE